MFDENLFRSEPLTAKDLETLNEVIPALKEKPEVLEGLYKKRKLSAKNAYFCQGE